MGENEDNNENFEPKIIAFLCNWCSYAGADLAGSARIQYPTNVKIIKVMCSSRINPLFVLRAFRKGADGVLVSGCHPGDCHYLTGNFFTRRRLILFKKQLEWVGIDPGRFHMSWVSASEGQGWADVVNKVIDDVKELGPQDEMRRKVIQDE